MDYHTTEWEEKGVVLDKPRRGREMVTKEVPKDLLDTMRIVTAKQQLKDGKDVREALEMEREGDAELYHEGWVDGKKYLVPDSNLEIMKDLVNMKMRRKGDSVFVKDQEYEESRLNLGQKYENRLRALSRKINELEAAKFLKKKSTNKTNEDTEGRSPGKEKTSSPLARRKPFAIVPMSDESTTFLVSGHIRENASPLFIVQKYKGESPFGRRRSDFSRVQSTRDVDILISGNFFRKSVLEEGLHSIEGIRLKWDQLVPVDERSKVYEKRFSEVFNVKGEHILFEGDFIKENGMSNYTPMLTFLVQRSPSTRRRGKDRKKSRTPCRSISNVFCRKEVKTYNVQIENTPSTNSTTGVFTFREDNSSGSSIEELDGRWLSVERDVEGGVEEDNESCRIHFVMMPSRNVKRSVAGGSSNLILIQDETVTSEENPLRTTRNEWNNNGVDVEETVVVYAPVNELWGPFGGDEPNLRPSSNDTTRQRGPQERSDQGDSDRRTTRSKSEEDPRHNSGLHRSEGLHPSEEELSRRTLSKNEINDKDINLCLDVPEYKCQVRPSKRGAQRNCLLHSISKLFSK